MSGKVKAVSLEVFHHDCVCSLLTQKFPKIRMSSQGSTHFFRKDGKLEGYQLLFEIKAESGKELDEFLKELKEFPTIKKFEVWGKLGSTAFVFLYIKTPSSTHEKMLEKNCVYFDKIKMARGFDIHSVVTTSLKDLKSAISSLEEIGEVKIKKIGAFGNSVKKDSLTEKQVNALKKAVSFDYYSWPRKANLESLAKESKLSRRAYQEHLRKAESKIIPKLLKEFLVEKSVRD